VKDVDDPASEPDRALQRCDVQPGPRCL